MPPSLTPTGAFLRSLHGIPIYHFIACSVKCCSTFTRVCSSDCWLLSSIEGLVPGKNRIAGNGCSTVAQCDSCTAQISKDIHIHNDTLVVGAIDWDLEKVADEAAEREYKRQQAEQKQQEQASSPKGNVAVCGQSLPFIAILFAGFGGAPDSLCTVCYSCVHVL